MLRRYSDSRFVNIWGKKRQVRLWCGQVNTSFGAKSAKIRLKIAFLTDHTLGFFANLTDQIAQYLDNAFQKALEICKTKKALWEKVRQVFDLLPALSMNAIYKFIALNRQANHPILE